MDRKDEIQQSIYLTPLIPLLFLDPFLTIFDMLAISCCIHPVGNQFPPDLRPAFAAAVRCTRSGTTTRNGGLPGNEVHVALGSLRRLEGTHLSAASGPCETRRPRACDGQTGVPEIFPSVSEYVGTELAAQYSRTQIWICYHFTHTHTFMHAWRQTYIHELDTLHCIALNDIALRYVAWRYDSFRSVA